MTDQPDPIDPDLEIPPRAPEDDAKALRLRGEPPRVVRLSRKVLATGAAVAALAVGGALTFALQGPNREGGPATELYNTEHRAMSEQVATAPGDYTELAPDVPELGPPLPGDLGGPILNAQRRGEDVPVPAMGSSGGTAPSPAAPSPEEVARQRALQEQDAAQTSRLFLGRQGGQPAAAEAPPMPVVVSASPVPPQSAASTATGARAFLEAPPDRRTAGLDRLSAAPSPYVLQAGSVIPAALIGGLRSDLPGQVSAQVTQNVYDSPTGRILLVPQGSRLVGDYDSQVSAGQRRLMVVWTRLILPDGRSIVLERQPAGDAAGYAGLEDQVDHHWSDLSRAAALSTLLGVGAELGRDSDDEVVRAIRDAGQDTFNRAGQDIVRRQLSVAPTLTIRPGYPVRVLVSRDLVLEPWRAAS
jgi:type IV secretion system protein VirB10